MTVRQLVDELAVVAAESEVALAVREELTPMALREGLGVTPELRREFARVRLVFEAARAGGFWGLQWAITDREPNSTDIWAQWTQAEAEPDLDSGPTATAECDELSALAAFLLHRLGIGRVGLYYPTTNHTVAVWKVRAPDGTEKRVVLPTSQVFLPEGETLGTLGFEGYPLRPVFDYRRDDVPPGFVIPRRLGEWFLKQARRYASMPTATLQSLRNTREARWATR
jgi:hypothetical protein